MASHWVVIDTLYGIAFVLAVFVVLFVIEFWPIILTIVIFTIGFITYIYLRNKKAGPH